MSYMGGGAAGAQGAVVGGGPGTGPGAAGGSAYDEDGGGTSDADGSDQGGAPVDDELFLQATQMLSRAVDAAPSDDEHSSDFDGVE